MSPLRHAAAWVAAIVGAASFTSAFGHPSDLEWLAQRWQAQLVDGFGHARAMQVRASALAAGTTVLPPLLALRMSTLGAWSWLLVPLWLAAALQGWAISDIRRASFAASNPTVNRLACHAAVAIVGAVLLGASLPIDMPVASIPAAGVLVAVLVAGHFAHRPAWRG